VIFLLQQGDRVPQVRFESAGQAGGRTLIFVDRVLQLRRPLLAVGQPFLGVFELLLGFPEFFSCSLLPRPLPSRFSIFRCF